MIKVHCIELANRVIDRVIQIHGGIGISNELKLTKAYELARTLRVPDGRAEVLRRMIANQLQRGDIEL